MGRRPWVRICGCGRRQITAVARLAGEREERMIAQTETKEDLSILPEEAKKANNGTEDNEDDKS